MKTGETIRITNGTIDTFFTKEKLIAWKRGRDSHDLLLKIGETVYVEEENGDEIPVPGQIDEGWWAKVRTDHGTMYVPGVLLSGNPTV